MPPWVASTFLLGLRPARVAIYLDANAGAPLKASVVLEIQKLLGSVATPSESAASIFNPSSIHADGRRAKRWMAEARERIALSLSQGDLSREEAQQPTGQLARPGGAAARVIDPEQLLLTSSGSEANQLAIRSALAGRPGAHWITSPIEHDSILQLARENAGQVSYLPVTSRGEVDVTALARLWRPDTALVSLGWVNNETGVIMDLPAIAREVRARGALLHVDAAQAWGKLPIHALETGAHFLTLSAHKIGALAGTGVLWCAPGSKVSPLILGKQEKGRRGGTENLLGMVAAGWAAAEVAPLDWAARVAPVRDALELAITRKIPGTRVNGQGAARVANTLNLSFDGVEGDGIVMALDLAGYSVSSGSACSSGALEPSHVLLAMGHTREQAMAAVRISMADRVEWSTLEKFVSALERVVERMRDARGGAQSRLGVSPGGVLRV